MNRAKVEQSKLVALFYLIALFFCGPAFGSVPTQFQQLLPVDEQVDIENAVVSYIYVDANEDGAGGGHTGLRIGDVVFHFQRSLDGFFMLDRSPWNGFLYTYSRIENRNITETYLKVSNDQKKQLINQLTTRSMQHRLLVKKYRELGARRDRLYQLSKTGQVDVSYAALGYYSFSIEELTYFTDSSVLPGDFEDIELTLEQYLNYGLANGFEFKDSQFVKTNLGLPSSQTLKAVESRIILQLNQVIQTNYNNRPDRARTYLELRVLLEAIQRSKRSNQLVIPQMVVLASNQNQISEMVPNHKQKEDAPKLDNDDTKIKTFTSMYNQSLSDLEKRQSDLIFLINRFFQSAAMLEASNLNNPRQLIQQGLIMDTPSLSVTVNRKYSDLKIVDTELEELQNQMVALKSDLDNELSYSILNRNCVTLLLDEINKVVKLDLPLKRPITSLLFVPTISNKYLYDSMGSGEQFYYRSFRNEYLNWLARQQPVDSWVMWNSETSTVSSKIYSFNDRDSVFLFFTEDQGIVKPVFGIANLMASSLQIVAGLLYSPVDGGRNFSNGLRGFSFSVTEICWLSIRKGTFRSDNPLFYSLPTIQRIK